MKVEEMNQFQEKLINMRTQILSRIENLSNDKRRKYGALDADFEEQAVQIMNDEVVDSLDEMERAELDKINNALVHIQNKTYGICASCGVEISQKRLNARPFSITCIDCAESK